MTHRPYDVIVVPFPYSDRLAEKRRPALVVSSPALERRCGLIWVAMITSAGRPVGFGDVPLQDLGSTGLPAPSMVRAGKIATIEPQRVLRTIGGLSQRDRDAASLALKDCAGF
jgi:mRNA interferase MazF